MTFPLDQRGQIKCNNIRALNVDDFKQRFLVRASDELKAVKAYDVEIEGGRVSFRGGMFRFGFNWNLLIQIDKGYVEAVVAPNGLMISYYISFRQLLIVSSCVVGVMAVYLSAGRDPTSPMGKVTLVVGAWLFLFGLNWLIATVRFPLFIERILRETE